MQMHHDDHDVYGAFPMHRALRDELHMHSRDEDWPSDLLGPPECRRSDAVPILSLRVSAAPWTPAVAT